jgi:cell division protein FtsB
MDSHEQLVVIAHRVEELERKVDRQRREIDSLRKRVAALEEAVPEWEPDENEPGR